MSNHVLIVSPIPTHPQDQGNSARIYSVARVLQSAGLIVHFLYYRMEGLSPLQAQEMRDCWDHFHTVHCNPRDMSPTGPGYYMLDDWWEAHVADFAAALHRRWRFSAVIANYVWFSAVLDAFPDSVLKVLDTHDVFGGRATRFLDAGLKPEWFYTTLEEESEGLARADIVLAIQDEEAAHFKALGHSDVRVIGHLLPLRTRAVKSEGTEKIVAGYLASGNPINLDSLERLRHGLAQTPILNMEFIVAGSICDKLSGGAAPFIVQGRVNRLDEFYDTVDLVLNPMTFGTGLKIKSVEAIFEGLPLVATKTAMVGLPIHHELHSLTSPEELADRVSRISRADLSQLAVASRDCAFEYADSVRKSFQELVSSIL